MSHTVRPTAGWYTDPGDSTVLRWWNGAEWSDHTQPFSAGAVLTAERSAQTHRPELAEVADEISVRSDMPSAADDDADPPVAAPASMGAAKPPTEQPAGDHQRRGRGKRVFVVVLIVLLLLGAAAAAGWYRWIRPSSTESTSAASTPDPALAEPAAPAVPADAPVPGACTDVVSALTADGTSSQLTTQLQTVAAGGELTETASFFASIGPVTSDLLANSGAACVAAVNNGQGPAAYATFVNAFQAAMTSGTQIVDAGSVQPGGLTAEQKAELAKQATELTAATAVVAKDAPVAPAGPPAG